MSTYTSIREMVPTVLLEAVTAKADSEGKTLNEVVVELLSAYTASKPPTRKKNT